MNLKPKFLPTILRNEGFIYEVNEAAGTKGSSFSHPGVAEKRQLTVVLMAFDG